MVACIGVSGAVFPGNVYAENGGIGLRAGAGSYYQRYERAWTSPSLWQHQFSGSGTRLDLAAEVGAAFWKASGNRERSSVWQIGFTPFLRWTFSNNVYLEAGVGVNRFSHTRFANRTLSTQLQFGSHLGVGVSLSSSSRLGLRYSHYSNASIKRPNDGLDVFQITYTHAF
jgi:lipid A 3-O-deacylase